MEKIRVLVVDDSAFMRKIIPEMLNKEDGIEVIGTAKDGNEAFKKVVELSPDVVTLDVEMPKMGGLETLGYIMSEKPTPVIMLSAYTPRGAETTIRALEYGAVDFVCKPSGEISLDIKKVKDELVEKIRAAKNIDTKKLSFMLPETVPQKAAAKEKEGAVKNDVMVIIASSTGGPRALTEVVPKLPVNCRASVLIVQHMSEGFTKTLAERINSMSKLRVREAGEGDRIESGHVYLAPGNFHMEVSKTGQDYVISLNQKPARLGVRPNADYTFFSAVKHFHGRIVGVILTGMGRDGAEGAEKVREKGGYVIAQDRETSVIYGMPKAAAERDAVDEVQPLGRISEAIMAQVNKDSGAV